MAKKPTKSRNMSVYSNLTHKRKTKKDAESRKKAEYLASLPKHPMKRLVYRMHPKRLAAYWFSKKGGIMALKIAGVGALLIALMVGALFTYYRKELDSIRPGELSKRVQTTVTKYLDRNGNLLWEDKGDGNYKLVVDGKNINNYMKQATVAIEDKDFYKHGGVSVSGITRSLVNNARGGDVQGGSTLTQQLVKQVFFADEAQKRGLNGIPRKIKEMILSIEVERMYDKDQILNLYLNESPYGGRRNGVESGAQTYFNKAAKDLTLPEAALLAAIPNNPSIYDPYNINGHEALITRQHKVLDNMAEQGYVTKAQSDEAKKWPVFDHLQKASSQYEDIKAPHFVQMVRSQLESELGKATVGRGGLTVKTTLDLGIQNKLEESMTSMFNSYLPNATGFSNGAATVEDTQTGQIVAMMGSRDFTYEGYGQDNAALAYIQPGSTIKPFVYGQLMQDKGAGNANYGSGSVLADDNSMTKIYGSPLQNFDGRYMGNISIRKSLALSRNVPAVKAMYISGVPETIDTIHALGNTSYCTQGADTQAGLSTAIGGCGNRQVDLVNGYASLARMGVYKPTSTVLEVTNSQGEVIKKFKDDSGKQIIDPQVAYILADILSDDNARAGLHGAHAPGLWINGVRTATKTGTSDKGGQAKDLWVASYSPALTMGVWLGNPDTSVLKSSNSAIPGRIVGPVMDYAHKEVYAKEGKWDPANGGSWYTMPAGVQKIGNELYPSWYNKNQGQTNAKLTFDKVSKKKATDCTPSAARIELDVQKFTDPITKREGYIVPGGYDATKDDDTHSCDDAKPSVTGVTASGGTIKFNVQPGKGSPSQVDVTVGGASVGATKGSGTSYSAKYTGAAGQAVVVTVTDDLLYTASGSATTTGPGGND